MSNKDFDKFKNIFLGLTTQLETLTSTITSMKADLNERFTAFENAQKHLSESVSKIPSDLDSNFFLDTQGNK